MFCSLYRFEIAAKAFKKVDIGRTGELMEFAKV